MPQAGQKFAPSGMPAEQAPHIRVSFASSATGILPLEALVDREAPTQRPNALVHAGLDRAIALMAVAAMYLAMRLFAPATPLLAVAIGIPTLAVAALLPGNVGGFGGNQAAAALVFAALELDPGAAVLASLLVSIVGLLATSIGGAIWAPRAWNPSGAGVL